jgi:hypothetical protein
MRTKIEKKKKKIDDKKERNRKLKIVVNPLTPELNPLAQRCLPRYFIGDFNF